MTQRMTQKECNYCNEIKSLDDFYFRLSKDKNTKYYNAKCKKCTVIKAKDYIGHISNICFRCGITTVNSRAKKYCSNVCRYEARSELDTFKKELGIDVPSGYVGQTY
jgi:hypothetical protein